MFSIKFQKIFKVQRQQDMLTHTFARNHQFRLVKV